MKTLTLKKHSLAPIPMDTAEWTAALRSGEYKQGRGRLFGFGEYCCLGVMAKLDGSDLDGGNYTGPCTAIHCVGEFSDFCTIENETDYKKGKSVHYTLACLNDQGVPFPVIADIIDFLWGNDLGERTFKY